MSEIEVAQQDFSLSLYRAPEVVLNEAKVAATALMNVLNNDKNPVVLNNKRHLKNEDWLTLARFYGVTARVKKTTYVEFGEVRGWEANAEAFSVSSGQVIATADSMCLSDEENWGSVPKYEYQDVLDENGKKQWDKSLRNGKGGYISKRVQIGLVPKPLFQLRSMAQTRATSKVLSLVFKWVVVLAGYSPTPAEEMDETIENEKPEETRKTPQRKSATKQPDTASQESKPEEKRDSACITEAQERMIYAVSNKAKLTEQELHEKLEIEFTDKDGNPLQHVRDMKKGDVNKFLESMKEKVG